MILLGELKKEKALNFIRSLRIFFVKNPLKISTLELGEIYFKLLIPLKSPKADFWPFKL